MSAVNITYADQHAGVIIPPPDNALTTIGASIVLVFTREFACPATVTAIHDDGSTIDLTARVPETGWKFRNRQLQGGQLERYRRMSLVDRDYKGVRHLDPLVIVDRVAIPMNPDAVATAASSGGQQTTTDVWVAGPKRRRLPEMQRLIPGTWFDPSVFAWTVFRRREERRDRLTKFVEPAVEKVDSGILDYAVAFDKYFKGYKKLSTLWDRVEIRPEKRR